MTNTQRDILSALTENVRAAPTKPLRRFSEERLREYQQSLARRSRKISAPSWLEKFCAP